MIYTKKIKPLDKIPLCIEDNKIICLPNLKDKPVIGIVGKKGMGMSLMLHRMGDLAYWKAGRKVGILKEKECDVWCTPWEVNNEKP